MSPAITSDLDLLEDEAIKLVYTDENFPALLTITGIGKYITIYQYVRFNTILEAVGQPYFKEEKYSTDLYSGAIHCYRKIYDDGYLNWWKRSGFIILKVKGIDPIAYNNNEIAFRRIEVIEEMMRD